MPLDFAQQEQEQISEEMEAAWGPPEAFWFDRDDDDATDPTPEELAAAPF